MSPFEAFLMSSGVTTDSRDIPIDSIFFALKGERFNGNDYALKALELGAKYAVVDEGDHTDPRIMEVKSVLESLQQCAKEYRRHLAIPIIGLTGSNGKTTNKEHSCCLCYTLTAKKRFLMIMVIFLWDAIHLHYVNLKRCVKTLK